MRARISLVLFAAALLRPPLAQTQQLAEGWDFVPGEKLLLFDDFSDMQRGGAPPHWKVRGASVKLGANGRLLIAQQVDLYPNVASWPRNYTIEMDLVMEKSAAEGQVDHFSWQFGDADGNWMLRLWFECARDDRQCGVHLDNDAGSVGQAETKFADGELNKMAFWVQDGRMRVYWNGERLIDANQVATQPWTHVWLTIEPNEAPVSLARFRIAESAPDFSKTIFSTGRFVTHGIQFDVNSDRLRPESMPVLKIVAEAMTQQSALKLRIEGHTDTSGDAAKNLDLSKRRAESVRNALIKQFGIAAERLTAEGLGQTKPLSPNDTPQGRANNRRVEFAKM